MPASPPRRSKWVGPGTGEGEDMARNLGRPAAARDVRRLAARGALPGAREVASFRAPTLPNPPRRPMRVRTSVLRRMLLAAALLAPSGCGEPEAPVDPFQAMAGDWQLVTYNDAPLPQHV